MANTLNGIDLFATVVEAGASPRRRSGFTSPARRWAEAARLELRLGVQLFHRTTRSQSLTEEGRSSIATACGRWRRCVLGNGAGQQQAHPQRQIEGLHAGAVRPAVRGPILLALAKAHPGWPWSCRSAIARWIWWRRWIW